MKDRSDDPSHHERTLLPRSYLAPLYEREMRRDMEPTERDIVLNNTDYLKRQHSGGPKGDQGSGHTLNFVTIRQ